MSKKYPPNPYTVLKAAALELEAAGIDTSEIIDAAFVTAVHGAIRTVGRDVTSAALRDMAERVAAPDDDGEVRH